MKLEKCEKVHDISNYVKNEMNILKGLLSQSASSWGVIISPHSFADPAASMLLITVLM